MMSSFLCKLVVVLCFLSIICVNSHKQDSERNNDGKHNKPTRRRKPRRRCGKHGKHPCSEESEVPSLMQMTSEPTLTPLFSPTNIPTTIPTFVPTDSPTSSDSTSFIIYENGGIAEIQDIIKVTFENGTFENNTTLFEVTIFTPEESNENTSFIFNDTSTYEMFNVFADIKTPEIIIKLEELPITPTLSVELNIPESLQSAFDMTLNESLSFAFRVLMLCTHSSILQQDINIFILLTTQYDPINQILCVELPTQCFNNYFNDDTYDAVLTMALTPGPNTLKTRRLQDDPCENNDNRCDATSIQCPIATGCDDSIVSGPFSREIVPSRGRPHYGTDYAIPTGTRINAAASGTVSRSYTSTSYGETVIIRHNDGSSTLYAHLDSRAVSTGDTVTAGQQIGESGNTGASRGAHLHFEYVPNGNIIQNPNRIDPHECIGTNLDGSITVGDNGPAADDAFEILIDNFSIGTTTIGAINNLVINNIIPGQHSLTIIIQIAPDDIGTYIIRLSNGWTFTDGTIIKTGRPSQGTVINYTFNVPNCN